MGRGKLSMELIINKKRRNTTYQNRKAGIIKKANELSVLCDVNTLIIFCPPDSNHPDIWCQNPDQINSIILSYKQEKNKNGKRLTCDLDDYFQSRKRKMEDQLIRTREKNREAKYPTWFDDLNGLPDWQLRQFAMGLERKELITTAHLHLKIRNFNVPMSFVFDIGNNQAANGYYQNLYQVQALISHGDVGRSDVYAAANHYMGSNPSLDQVQDFNHALEWTDDEPTTSIVQLEPELGISFDYLVSEGEVVYETSEPCEYQPVQQCCLMPEKSALEKSDVNDDEPATSFVQLDPKMGIRFNYPVSDDEPTTSSVQLEPEMGISFNYPVSEGEVVYETSEPCECQPVQLEPEMGIRFDYPVSGGEVVYEACEYQKCCPMPEKSALEKSYDGVGIEEFVIEDDLDLVMDLDMIEDDLDLVMDLDSMIEDDIDLVVDLDSIIWV